MANTANIQILRSYVTATPPQLLDGQLAYSFVSNTLFIGSNNRVISIVDSSTRGIAQSGYLQANTATVLANAAYFHANGAFIKANDAYVTANSAQSNTIYTQDVDVTQNTRLTVIEGTDSSQNVSINTQNSFITILQGVNLTQNTNISSTDGKMQSAYNQANTGTVLAQAAYNQANASLLGVNSAITIIQGVDVGQNSRMTIIEGTVKTLG